MDRAKQNQTEPITFLRWPEVVRRIGMSKSSVANMIRDNGFPKPVQIGGRACGFVASEVDSYLARLVERSRGASDVADAPMNKREGGV
jgi:prophage regulatory protein